MVPMLSEPLNRLQRGQIAGANGLMLIITIEAAAALRGIRLFLETVTL